MKMEYALDRCTLYHRADVPNQRGNGEVTPNLMYISINCERKETQQESVLSHEEYADSTLKGSQPGNQTQGPSC